LAILSLVGIGGNQAVINDSPVAAFGFSELLLVVVEERPIDLQSVAVTSRVQSLSYVVLHLCCAWHVTDDVSMSIAAEDAGFGVGEIGNSADIDPADTGDFLRRH